MRSRGFRQVALVTMMIAVMGAFAPLPAQAAGSASLTGLVSAQSAAGVSFVAHVSLYRADGTLHTSTNTADGQFWFSGLDAGSYRLQFQTDQGGATNAISPYWGPGVVNLASAPLITIGAGETRTLADTVIPPGAILSGRLTGQQHGSEYFVGGYVEAWNSSGPVTRVYPDVDGDYSISGLGAGTYYVKFFSYYSQWVPEGWSNRSVDSPDPIILTAQQVRTGVDAELSLTGTATISGVVQGNTEDGRVVGVNSAHVFLYTLSGELVDSTQTSSGGAYTLDFVAAGQYRVNFAPPSVAFSGHEWFSQWLGGTTFREPSTVVTAVPGGTSAGNDAIFELGATISGTVTKTATGTGGQRAAIVWVLMRNPWSGEYEIHGGGTVAPDGRYTATLVPPGEVVIEFGEYPTAASPLYATEYWNDVDTPDQAVAITVPSRAALVGYDAHLDLLQMPLQPRDFSGDGNADVLAVAAGGGLYMYRGSGDSGWAGASLIGSGWNGFNLLTDVGDFDGDGNPDVMGRVANGDLYLYKGNGSGGWLGAVRVGTGWHGFSSILGAGDFDGDGNPDVIARTPSGALYLYKGNGVGGWAGFTSVFGVGDFSGDGFGDVMARTASGDLYLYRGNGSGGWLGATRIGIGWQGFSSVVGAGDFSGDGVPDVLAKTSAGALYLYRGNGSGGWASSSLVGSGWGGMSLVH